MFGSGEKTVAPTTDFPSRSFCLAVLKFRTGAFCCCACASPSTIQDSAIQIVANEMEYSSLTGLHLGSTTFDRRRIILRPENSDALPPVSSKFFANAPSFVDWGRSAEIPARFVGNNCENGG